MSRNYSESETDGAEALANKPIILINAQIGGSSLGIKEKTGGAQSQFSGVIALLAIADALKNENPADFAKSIVFGFFGAESFDYSGNYSQPLTLQALDVSATTYPQTLSAIAERTKQTARTRLPHALIPVFHPRRISSG
jgi:hypothetical protein